MPALTYLPITAPPFTVEELGELEKLGNWPQVSWLKGGRTGCVLLTMVPSCLSAKNKHVAFPPSGNFCSCECHRGELNLSGQTESSFCSHGYHYICMGADACTPHARTHTFTLTGSHCLALHSFIPSNNQNPLSPTEHRSGCWGLKAE